MPTQYLVCLASEHRFAFIIDRQTRKVTICENDGDFTKFFQNNHEAFELTINGDCDPKKNTDKDELYSSWRWQASLHHLLTLLSGGALYRCQKLTLNLNGVSEAITMACIFVPIEMWKAKNLEALGLNLNFVKDTVLNEVNDMLSGNNIKLVHVDHNQYTLQTLENENIFTLAYYTLIQKQDDVRLQTECVKYLEKQSHQQPHQQQQPSSSSRSSAQSPLFSDPKNYQSPFNSNGGKTTKTPLWWMNVSNAWILVAALSGVLIPTLNKHQAENTFSGGDGEIMLIASAVLLGVAWMAMSFIQHRAHQPANTSLVSSSYHSNLSFYRKPYIFCLGVAVLGAAGVMASCGWLLSSGAWNELKEGSSLLNSQSERTFTALYGILSGASALAVITHGLENRHWLKTKTGLQGL